jgi:hypothetical protein
MICDLLALAEISHELSEMNKGETFSLFCEQNGSRCCDLKFDVWDAVLGHNALSRLYPDCLVEMGWAIRNLAHRLEIHFMKRMTQRAGKGL